MGARPKDDVRAQVVIRVPELPQSLRFDFVRYLLLDEETDEEKPVLVGVEWVLVGFAIERPVTLEVAEERPDAVELNAGAASDALGELPRLPAACRGDGQPRKPRGGRCGRPHGDAAAAQVGRLDGRRPCPPRGRVPRLSRRQRRNIDARRGAGCQPTDNLERALARRRARPRLGGRATEATAARRRSERSVDLEVGRLGRYLRATASANVSATAATGCADGSGHVPAGH